MCTTPRNERFGVFFFCGESPRTMRAYARFVIDGPTLTRLVASFALRMEFDSKTDHRQSFDEGREGVWGRVA